MDAQLLFSESQDLGSTSASAGVVSTNNVYAPQIKDFKHSNQNQRVNVSGKLYWNNVVEDEAFAGSGGSATVTVSLLAHTAAITASNYSAATTVDSFTMTADASGANYPDGQQIASRAIPQGQIAPYMAVWYAVTTKKLKTGFVTSWIGNAIQQGQ